MFKYYIDDLEVTQDVYYQKLDSNFYDESILKNENGREFRLNFNKEKKEKMLRKKRDPLLLVFDKWEKAVLRGREVDDPNIMLWYQDLKELKESAFENIPNRISYYLGGLKK